MGASISSQAARAARTRANVVEAAISVFALKGYAAASMDDVRLAAGISKGGLYHHFATKGAVLRGVCSELARWGELPPRPPGQPRGVPLTSEALACLLLDIWSTAGRDEQLRASLAGIYATAGGDLLAQILADGAVAQLALSLPVRRGEVLKKLGMAA